MKSRWISKIGIGTTQDNNNIKLFIWVRGLEKMHTDAKSQFLFKNWTLMKSTQTFEYEFSRQKFDYWEFDFLNKNWDFATVCDMLEIGARLRVIWMFASLDSRMAQMLLLHLYAR